MGPLDPRSLADDRLALTLGRTMRAYELCRAELELERRELRTRDELVGELRDRAGDVDAAIRIVVADLRAGGTAAARVELAIDRLERIIDFTPAIGPPAEDDGSSTAPTPDQEA